MSASFGDAAALIMTPVACCVLHVLLIITAAEMGKRETAMQGQSG